LEKTIILSCLNLFCLHAKPQQYRNLLNSQLSLGIGSYSQNENIDAITPRYGRDTIIHDTVPYRTIPYRTTSTRKYSSTVQDSSKVHNKTRSSHQFPQNGQPDEHMSHCDTRYHQLTGPCSPAPCPCYLCLRCILSCSSPNSQGHIAGELVTISKGSAIFSVTQCPRYVGRRLLVLKFSYARSRAHQSIHRVCSPR